MLNSVRLAVIVASTVLVAHVTWIDRLNVTKLTVGAIATTLAVVLLLARKRMTPVGPLWALSAGILLLALVLFPEFVWSRVEGWSPLVVAAALFSLAAAKEERKGTVVLAWVGGGLAAVAVLQAIGFGLFTSQVHVFASQRVMGTLGNPSLYGICLALLLPFCLARAKSGLFAAISSLVVIALILSGARTAWVMVLPSFWVAAKLMPWRRTAIVALAGISIGVAIGAATNEVDLTQRVSDVSSSRGTAAGRLYLWRVNLNLVIEAGPFGGGPGAFQQRWPHAQGEYLADHPPDRHFYSDIRHAHADLVEVAVDWGWFGLILFAIGVVRLLRSKDSAAESPATTAARGAVAAALVGGLGSSILFQPPSLFVAAVAAGLVWSAQRGDAPEPHWRWSVVCLLSLVTTSVVVGRHAQSELLRTEGLKASVASDDIGSSGHACRAAEVQSENPLALAMCAMSLVDSRPDKALVHAEHAARLLPTAEVYALISFAAQEAGDEERASEALSLSLWLRGN